MAMDLDNRIGGRDSLFLLADLRLVGDEHEYRVKVRNVSPGGLMAEGDVAVSRGMQLELNLRNIGWVAGEVAWVQDNRFGVAFVDEIDPKQARAPLEVAPSQVPPQLRKLGAEPPRPARPVRKV